MSYFIVTGIRYDIRFNEKEYFGAEYLKPLVRLTAALPSYGRAESSSPQVAKRIAESIDAAFEELKAIHSGYGKVLAVTAEDLSERKRENLIPAELESRWRAVRDSARSASIRSECAALAADARELIAYVGDSSNLILDPDLDSYYLMDVVLLALPDAIVRLEKESDRTTDSPETRRLFASLHAEVDVNRIVASSRTALEEDKRFLGISATLQDRLPAALSSFESASAALIAASISSDPAAYDGELEKMTAAALSFWTVLDEELSLLLDRRVDDHRSKLFTALATTAVAVLLAYATVWAIARNLLVQIAAMRRLVSAMASKDLRKKESAISKDELGATAADMALLAGELSSSLKLFLKSVRALDQSSRDVSGSSTEMTKTSESLASSVEQIAASMEESAVTMSSVRKSIERQFGAIDRTTGAFGAATKGLNSVAESMEVLRRRAAEGTSTAHESGEAISSLIAESRKLGDHSRSLADRIGRIDEATSSIRGIVDAVSDIADRTSLLAMNASIEAAHAGAAGRGFAVVASSIRELASLTMKALESIRERMGHIDEAVRTARSDSTLVAGISLDVVTKTSGAEEAIERLERVIKGLEADIVDATAIVVDYRSLVENSLSEAGELKSFSETIKSAVEEQDIGAKEIIDAVLELRGASMRNAESSESLSRLSATLKDESCSLDRIVREFTLDEESSPV